MWVAYTVFAFLALFLLSNFADKVSEIVRILRRIESRLTLLQPLEEEKKTFEREWIVKAHIQDRAIHPDVWNNNENNELRDLKVEEWKKVRETQRYRDKKYRD